MALPTLTPEQRAEALEKARISRNHRAEVKSKLKTGAITLRELLDSAEEDVVIGKTKVKDIITSLPKIGKVKAQEIMEEIGIHENRRVRGLGDKQREQLLDIVEN